MLIACVLWGVIPPHNTTSATFDLTRDWRFKPDLGNLGLQEGWASPDHPDQDWAVIVAGARWEDQGFPDVDGAAWYRRWVSVPDAWQGKQVWLKLGAVNDDCIVFCNGARVNSFGVPDETSVADQPLAVDLTSHLHFGQPDLIALRVVDRGISGGLWRLPCMLTTDSGALADTITLDYYTQTEARKFTVEIDATGLGNERDNATLRIRVCRKGKTVPIQQQEIALARGTLEASAAFPLPTYAANSDYDVYAALMDSSGRPLGGPERALHMATPKTLAWPAPYHRLRVLNSLVTELLSKTIRSKTAELTFLNPRAGWVFVSLSGPSSEAAHAQTVLGARPEPLVLRANLESGALEAMVRLEKGPHTLRVSSAKGVRLDVRAVPELAYCYYLANPHIAPYGPYDKAFLDRYVAPHVNTYVTSGMPPEADLAEWVREGRQWITNASLPGLGGDPVPAANVYADWMAAPGVTDARIGGLIVDEFISASAGHYQSWTEAMERMYDTPAFRGKTFYAFCGDLYRDPNSLEFAQDLLRRGGVFALERYLCEEPGRDAAIRWIHRQYRATVRQWDSALPGACSRLMFVLGFMSAPPESLDNDPALNYNVLTEMQLHLIANDPAFFGLYGLMEYSASYSDEESLRWAYRLFRHYAIEGKREPLSNDPYELDHLKNPDFANGLAGWTVEGAGPESVATQQMEGWSWLEGRYPKTKQGDTFAVMTRSVDHPNVLRQTLRNLQPGRAYSLRLFAADPQHLDAKQELALTARLMDGAGEIASDARSFRFMFPSNYAHTLGPYNSDHPAWFTYLRIVFKPRKDTAELAISDWADPNTPGGPIGGQTAVNFVQVQPYWD
jgi:hypothetical protein